MDRIILEVDDVAAKNWRYTSEKKKMALTNAINQILKAPLEKSDEDFYSLLDRIGKEADANGLTQESLNKFLKVV